MTKEKSFYQVKFSFNSTEEFIEWMKQNEGAWNDVTGWFNFMEDNWGYSSIQEAIEDDEWFNDWSHETDWSTGIVDDGNDDY